jgi:DNA/RNA endonuclease YhcR with UshA esterase domain
MEDKTLLNIASTVAVIGIIILLLLSYYNKIPERAFNEITSKDLASYVKVKGTVKQVYMHNNSMSIQISQECLMYVNIFDNNQNISINDTVTIQGTVQEYKGKLQILADRVIK